MAFIGDDAYGGFRLFVRREGILVLRVVGPTKSVVCVRIAVGGVGRCAEARHDGVRKPAGEVVGFIWRPAWCEGEEIIG